MDHFYTEYCLLFNKGVIQRRCNSSGYWEIENHSHCIRRSPLEAISRMKTFSQKLGFDVSLSLRLHLFSIFLRSPKPYLSEVKTRFKLFFKFFNSLSD